VVRAIADPSDAAAVAAALLTPLVGLNGDGLFAARGDENQWERWTERFQSWHEIWQRSGFTAAFRRLLDDCEAASRILATRGGERCLTNVLHLGELLQAASVQTRRGPLALVEWLQRMRSDELARVQEAAESAQMRLESDTHALKLVTVHKSKGLQYPIVVCPYLWDGMLFHRAERYRTFHDPAAGDQLTVDLAQANGHPALAERERMAESLRLLYVALTRAEQLCLVVWGGFRGCATSGLGYLLHQADDAPPDQRCAATAQRLAGLSDAGLQADLDRLVAAAPGAIEVAELSRDAGDALAPEPEAGAALRLRTPLRTVAQRWRIASFSALAAGDQTVPEPAEEGFDRDELAEAATPGSEEPAMTPVRGFPRGRRLGTLVHRLFEITDFVSASRDQLRTAAAELLPAYGIEAQWADAVADAVCDVVETPLTPEPDAVRLRQVAAQRRLNELEFVFPVAFAADESPRHAFTADRLGGVFAAHGEGWLAGEYAARLRRLPFAPLSGYLKGYIDLVFAHGGRWYVADYKTNDLGVHAADYRAERLIAEMQRHHYALQAHLYAVAVHRYLQQRLPGYAYERDFGGVFYLFVRGMAPRHPPGCGVFFDRPRQALIEALSEALGQAADGSGR
jgi:exodeoxyribonuclease V beta subunit